MAGWHHRLDGHEFELTPGVGAGQGGLVCCNSWGRKELDMTEQLNWTEWKRISANNQKCWMGLWILFLNLRCDCAMLSHSVMSKSLILLIDLPLYIPRAGIKLTGIWEVPSNQCLIHVRHFLWQRQGDQKEHFKRLKEARVGMKYFSWLNCTLAIRNYYWKMVGVFWDNPQNRRK